MEHFVTGFWGSFFGVLGLVLAGAVICCIRALYRAAVSEALGALTVGFFALSFLGGLPFQNEDSLNRFLAHVAAYDSALMLFLLFPVIGQLNFPGNRCCILAALMALASVVSGAGWWLTPYQALCLGVGMASLMSVAGLLVCLRCARLGDRLALQLGFGVFAVIVGLGCISWIALDRNHVPWQVHILGALAGSVYMVTMSSAFWRRYSDEIELKKIMKYGPGYDPVTRMRSHLETGVMASAAFDALQRDQVPLGMVVVSIFNLPVLDKLYGQPAVNHALFVSASRLRHLVPANVQMGRLGSEAFLLLVPGNRDGRILIELAHRVQAALSQFITLHSCLNLDSEEMEDKQPLRWVASIGVGVMNVSGNAARAVSAVELGRGVSRTAGAYPSRVAWYDEQAKRIVGVPPMTLAG